MAVIETARLVLREFVAEDAEFLVALLNSPGWLEFIGDRNVRDRAAARRYIEDNLRDGYRRDGFGFWHLGLRSSDQPVGMCGLTRRDYLDAPDIGYALLPEHAGRGYAIEAARGVLDHARRVLALTRLLAITDAGNGRSVALLERLGMQFEGMVDSAEGKRLACYASSPAADTE